MRPRKVILCVDDNETALSVRKFLLETHGYRVVTAMSGREALEAFDARRPDLVVADLIMPGMHGDELVRRIKQIDSSIPAIITSGAVSRQFDTQADAFLPKACSPLDLLERVRVLAVRKRGPKKKGSTREQLMEASRLRRSA